jgi:ferredoxin
MVISTIFAVFAIYCVINISAFSDSKVLLLRNVYRTNTKVCNAANQVEVVFLPSNKAIMADINAPLKDVAAAADVAIKYKCQKGECGTCQVQVDGKWIKTCQTRVPAMPKGVSYSVTVKPFKEKAAFFSPQSFVDGFSNNVLGMAGQLFFSVYKLRYLSNVVDCLLCRFCNGRV